MQQVDCFMQQTAKTVRSPQWQVWALAVQVSLPGLHLLQLGWQLPQQDEVW